MPAACASFSRKLLQASNSAEPALAAPNDPPEPEASAAAGIDDGGDRDERECVGRAITHFAVDLHAGRRRRQDDGGDHLARPQHRFDFRRLAGQAMKRGNREAPRLTLRIDRLDDGIERPHRHRHVRGMRGDALIARAQDGSTGAPGPVALCVVFGVVVSVVCASTGLSVSAANRTTARALRIVVIPPGG
jgi:hypothetical protein